MQTLDKALTLFELGHKLRVEKNYQFEPSLTLIQRETGIELSKDDDIQILEEYRFKLRTISVWDLQEPEWYTLGTINYVKNLRAFLSDAIEHIKFLREENDWILVGLGLAHQ